MPCCAVTAIVIRSLPGGGAMKTSTQMLPRAPSLKRTVVRRISVDTKCRRRLRTSNSRSSRSNSRSSRRPPYKGIIAGDASYLPEPQICQTSGIYNTYPTRRKGWGLLHELTQDRQTANCVTQSLSGFRLQAPMIPAGVDSHKSDLHPERMSRRAAERATGREQSAPPPRRLP